MTHGDRVQERATGKIGVIAMIHPAVTLQARDGRVFDLPAKYQVQWLHRDALSEWLHESQLKLCETEKTE